MVACPGENGPIAVSFLVFGKSTTLGTQFLRDFKKLSDEYGIAEPVDVRTIYKMDPMRSRRFKVPHDRNADFECTQISTHQFRSLFDVVKTMCASVCDCAFTLNTLEETSLPLIFPFYCTSGNHRVDTSAKSAQHRVLNCINFGYGRAFNVNVFSLNNAANVAQQLVAARRWLTAPWTVLEPKPDWASAARASGERAMIVHSAIGELPYYMVGYHMGLGTDKANYSRKEGTIVEHACIDEEEVLIADDAEEARARKPAPRKPNPPPAPPTAKRRCVDGGGRQAEASEHGERSPKSDDGDSWGPWGAKGYEATAEAGTKWGEARGWDEWHSNETQWHSRWARHTTHSASSKDVVEVSECPFCKGTGNLIRDQEADELNKLEKNLEMLMLILKHHDVDEDARFEAYLLATRFPDGMEKLNDIVHSMLKTGNAHQK